MLTPAPLGQAGATLSDSDAEPPIVARIVVEVRSDGTRTIARGALEVEDEAVAFGAEGNSPAELTSVLTRFVLTQLRKRTELELLKWGPNLMGSARTMRVIQHLQSQAPGAHERPKRRPL